MFIYASSKWKTLDTMKNEESLQFNISIRKCITATWVMHRQCILWCSELVCLKKKLRKKGKHIFLEYWYGFWLPFLAPYLFMLVAHLLDIIFRIYRYTSCARSLISTFLSITQQQQKNKSGSQQTTHRHTSIINNQNYKHTSHSLM